MRNSYFSSGNRTGTVSRYKRPVMMITIIPHICKAKLYSAKISADFEPMTDNDAHHPMYNRNPCQDENRQ